MGRTAKPLQIRTLFQWNWARGRIDVIRLARVFEGNRIVWRFVVADVDVAEVKGCDGKRHWAVVPKDALGAVCSRASDDSITGGWTGFYGTPGEAAKAAEDNMQNSIKGTGESIKHARATLASYEKTIAETKGQLRKVRAWLRKASSKAPGGRTPPGKGECPMD